MAARITVAANLRLSKLCVLDHISFVRSTKRLFLCSPLSPLSLRVINTCAPRSAEDGNKFRIYTGTGDRGTSATFTGERRPKDDLVFEALGTIDELSATIGLARMLARDAGHRYVGRLERVQCALQDVASLVATPRSSARAAHTRRTGTVVPAAWIAELESWIDEYTAQLPPLTNFILPGGGVASATLHLARTVCRRAERTVTPLTRAGEVDTSVTVYLNRLSDFLFTVARAAAKADGVDEEIYVRPKTETTPDKGE